MWFKLPPETAAFCARALRALAEEHERVVASCAFVQGVTGSLARLESDRANSLSLAVALEEPAADSLYYIVEAKARLVLDAIEAAAFRHESAPGLAEAIVGAFSRPLFAVLPPLEQPPPPSDDEDYLADVRAVRSEKPS
jgi:hypothetical protein